MKIASNTLSEDSLPPLVDHTLLSVAAILIILGLIMVASASMSIADQQYHQPFYFLFRQLAHLAIGIFFAVTLFKTPIQFWQQWSKPLLFASFVLLTLVLIPGIGRHVNGSSRWLGIGPVGGQVSEVAKLCFFIYLADYLQRHEDAVRQSFAGFLKPLCVLAVIGFLLLREPDFGACVVITATSLLLLFVAGVRWRYCFIAATLVVAAFALLAITSPYRLQRLTAFLNPWANQFGSGYQLTQSLIAFGQGGWLGVGIGDSVQKLFYLPEAHTDFLFAVLGEELGFLGIALVIVCYVVLVTCGMRIAIKAFKQNEQFAGFLVLAISLCISLQAFINMGVNVGLLPTKGLTLPFMSYGGSSIIITCIMLALMLRVDHELRLMTLVGGVNGKS